MTNALDSWWPPPFVGLLAPSGRILTEHEEAEHWRYVSLYGSNGFSRTRQLLEDFQPRDPIFDAAFQAAFFRKFIPRKPDGSSWGHSVVQLSLPVSAFRSASRKAKEQT